MNRRSHPLNLLEDPIPNLIRRVGIPASIGFFFNTMYNVVDTFYAGKVSTEALAALSLSFPVFFILIAIGSGVSQGATALIGNALGEKNPAQAQRFAIQTLSFALVLSLLLMIAGLLAAPSLFRLLGASETYLTISLAYMNPILLGTFFFVGQSALNSTLQALGDTVTYRNVLIGGFLLNLVLDPWFLWGGFGVPPLGIAGIAIATVLIQALSCIYLYSRVKSTSLWSQARLRDLIPQLDCYREIARQGFPASLNMMTVALGIFVITWFISKFGKAGVAAYGIATRIEQIVLLPTIGLNIAVLSIVGQNNGAKQFERVRQAWKTGIQYGSLMMIIGGVTIFLSKYSLMKGFTQEAEVIQLGADYLSIASITLLAYVFLFQTVFMLQGLKRPQYAIWIGLYRQIVAPYIVFHFLAFTLNWKLWGIWWGIFSVTWSAAIITLFYGSYVLKSLKQS